MKKLILILTAFLLTVSMTIAMADSILPASLSMIEEEAFMGDSSLMSMIIPSGVTDIGARAFKDSGLTSITIPEGVTGIGEEAFANTPMSTITIPGSVTSIGDNALDADITVTAPAGSFAFQYCLEHSIALTYVNPDAVSLTERGQVTITIADPREQTVMLGVYHRAAAASRSYPIFLASGGVSDSPDAGTLKAVIPVTVEAGSASVTTDVSGLMQDSGSYYVRAKTVSSISAAGARDMTGPATISNRISYTRPECALEKPTDVQWSSTVYGRATWGKVAGAASYQVTLYNQEGIVAHRNVNTNHFTFSSGWLDLDHITENGYTFTVTALSDDIFTVSNSPESDASAVLGEPASTELSIITQPASRYASLGEPYSVSISAMGVGITYDWYQVVPEGYILLAGRSDDNVITLTADTVGYTEIFAVLTDAYGEVLPSESAKIHVIDDGPMDHMISTHPTDFTVMTEESHIFTVGADLARLPYGDDCKVSYQWYRGREGGVFTAVPNYNKSEYKVYTHNITSGFQTYCVVTVTAPTGKVIAVEQSETATLIINRPVIYFRKNLNYSYYNARSQSIHVEVAVRPDATLLRYRWVYYTGSEYENWHEWQGANTSYFPAYALTDEYEGAVLKCYADARYNGNIYTIESGPAHIHLGSNPATGIDIDANIDKANLTLYDSFRADFVLTPQDSTSSVYWFSTDQTVATVSDRGQVSIHGLGTAKIIGCTSPDVTIENGQVVQATGVWDEMPLTVNRVIVTFDPRGGRFADGEIEPLKWKCYVGEQITLPGLSKDGDTFLGWSLNGGSLGGGAITGYTVGEQCVLMTAMWENTTQEEDKELEIEQDLADNQPVSIGATALFEVVTNGAKVISYQWYENTGEGWTPINGGSMAGNKTSLNVECNGESIGSQYKVIITGANGIVRESNVCRLVNADTYDPDQPDPFEDPAGPVEEVHFTMQPENTMVQAGEPAEFYVGVDAPAEYQWQMLTDPDSSTWSDLSGETGTVLSIGNTTGDMTGNRYRCIVTAGGQELISNEAELDVLVLQIIADEDVSQMVAGETVGFTLSCNHSNLIDNNVQWSSMDSDVASVDEDATGNTTTVQIHGTGTMTITATVEGFTAAYELTIHHVTVTLDGNGGIFETADGTAAQTSVKADTELSYEATATFGVTPERDGYNFIGWDYQANGTPTEELSFTGNTTLYAVWQKIIDISVQRVITADSEPADDELAEGDVIVLKAVLSPEDETAPILWTAEPSSAITIEDVITEGPSHFVNVTIQGTGEITIRATVDSSSGEYAETQAEYSISVDHTIVTVHANCDQLGIPEDDPIRETETIILRKTLGEQILEPMEYEGFTFLGFCVMTDQGPTGEPAMTFNITGPITLQAQWERTPIEATSVTINMVEEIWYAGDTVLLCAIVQPENHESEVVWSVSDETFATISTELEQSNSERYCQVTFLKIGQGTITVTAGNVSHTIKVEINEAKVMLYGNDGTFDGVEAIEAKASGVYMPTQEPTREGYEFRGWSTTQDGEVVQEIYVQGPIELYAVWSKADVHATGVEIEKVNGPDDPAVGEQITLQAILTPVDSIDNVEWVSLDESVATIDNNGVVTIQGTGNLQIKATANATAEDYYNMRVHHVMVTLNGNGGSFEISGATVEQASTKVDTDLTYDATESFEMPLAQDGYDFVGWSLATDGAPLEYIQFAEATTLYAVWQEHPTEPYLTITGTDGNVTKNQRLVLTPQFYGSDGEPISDATYTWYDLATETSRYEFISDHPHWIDLEEGQLSFVVWDDITLLCVGTNGAITAEASITLQAADDMNEFFTWLETNDQYVYASMEMPLAPVTITCYPENISENATYRWEYYLDEGPWNGDPYPWQCPSGPYDMTNELYVELDSTGVLEIIYQFRCTVEVERNGIHFEYVSSNEEIHVYYDEAVGECTCGCGIPECTCGPECSMYGNPDPGDPYYPEGEPGGEDEPMP